jgi:hypothetical protein
MGKDEVVKSENINKGAEFSADRKYRYALWRIWDESKPLVMFIGLNPSTANEDENDPTIRSVERISKHNGYGGFYMMNCWPFVSTDPAGLSTSGGTLYNDIKLKEISEKCQDIVFAWGNFEIVKMQGVDYILSRRFPNAKALKLNKNGSPKHPLYCKSDTVLINYSLIN